MLIFPASCLVSFFVFVSWYGWWHFGGLAKTGRQRAYVVTLLSSCVMTLCSVPILYRSMTSPQGFMTFFAPGTTWTIAAVAFFMVSLACDLGIGAIFYRNQINLLTGWIHHTVYILVLFYVLHRDLTRFFVAMCILELPTLWLSVGSVFPQYRHDYVFASFFVPTRIGFHAYMIAYNIVTIRPVLVDVTVGLILLFPLHCYWFYGFILQQKRLWKAKKTTVSHPSVKTMYSTLSTVHDAKESNLVADALVSRMKKTSQEKTMSYVSCTRFDRPMDSNTPPILAH